MTDSTSLSSDHPAELYLFARKNMIDNESQANLQ